MVSSSNDLWVIGIATFNFGSLTVELVGVIMHSLVMKEEEEVPWN
jgi:hypothetical protein